MERFSPELKDTQPFSTSIDNDKLHQEGNHLKNIKAFFPETAWIQVLAKLTNHNDIENCSNASPYFWNFLKKKREASVVLPKVFLQLIDHFKKEESNKLDSTVYVEKGDAEDSTDDDEDSMGDNYNVLDWIGDHNENKCNDFSIYFNIKFCILKYREVCKMWNKVIEDLYQSQEAGHYELSLGKPNYAKRKYFYSTVAYSFEPRGEIQKFLHHFDFTHSPYQDGNPKKNPFLSRQVDFFSLNARDYGITLEIGKQYIDDITRFLKKYGSEIWYTNLQFDAGFDENGEQLYTQLIQFLQFLPNLKVLRIFFRDSLSDFAVDPDADLISQNRLPPLNNLEFLCSENLPTDIFNELIQKSKNINQLEVCRTICHGNYNIFSTNLPNLTTLSIQFQSIEDFENFENCNQQLNINHFSFFYTVHTFLPWSRIFLALQNKLGEKCEKLLLFLPKPMSSDDMAQVLLDSNSFRLNLPNLQEFTIFDDTPCSLDFLLPSKNSLQFMSLKYDEFSGPLFTVKRFDRQEQIFRGFDGTSVIQFIGYKTKLEESNIWREFPKLTNITFHEIKGKRGEFNCILSRKSNHEIKRHVILLRKF